MKTFISTIVGLLFLADTALAVTLIHSEGAAIPSGAFSYNYSVQQANSVLVVATYRDGGGTAYPSLSFGGAAHDGALVGNRTSLFYYLGAAAGDITISTAANNASNSGIYVWELGGVDLNAPVASAAGTEGDALNTQITTFGDNSFIVDTIGWNPTGVLDTTTVAIAPDADNTVIDAADFTFAINLAAGGVLGGGSGEAGPAGAYNLGWTITQSEGGQGNLNELAFAFSGVGSISGVAWGVDRGGNWSTSANWVGGISPAAGGHAIFGAALTAPNAPADVALNVAGLSVNKISIANPNTYNITGPNSLALIGSNPTVDVGAGAHEISATITGADGLTKTGSGALRLSGANTYSGVTSVQSGALQLANAASITGNVALSTGAQLQFVSGFDGAYSGSISGSGNVVVNNTMEAETVTLSGASSYDGLTEVQSGNLVVSHGNALGVGGGLAAAGTTVNGTLATGKLTLTGGVTVANEVLTLGAREGLALDAVHVSNSGINSWNGNVRGVLGGANYNFESMAGGVLTLSGTISAPDVNPRNFVFSGDGNFVISGGGKITDIVTDANGDEPANAELAASAASNVNVVKRGNGTLTVSTETNFSADYWYGSTVIEPGSSNTGRLVITADASDNGELRSSSITVLGGATLDISDFGTYSLWSQDFSDVAYSVHPAPSSLSGSGTVDANAGGSLKTLRVFESNTITPGDEVGTLTVDGHLLMTFFDNGAVAPPAQPIVPDTGSLDFELGNNASAMGGTENDLIYVTGDLTINQLNDSGANQWQVNVTAVENELANGGSGAYTLMKAGGSLGGNATNSNFSVALFDSNGVDLSGTTRQTLAVNLNASNDSMELVVSGSAADLTWTDVTNGSWDIGSSANWSASPTYFNLDHVTFDDSAGANDTVSINSGDVSPASVNFHSSADNTYNLTGSNGITGVGPVNLTGDVTVVLANNNNISGAVSLASGTTLALAGADTTRTNVFGVISGAGAISVESGDHVFLGSNVFTGAVTINGGQLNMNSATALGDTFTGTTINAGGALASFNDTYTSHEPLFFNGGRLIVGDAGTPTLSGPIAIQSGGASIDVQGAASVLTITGNVSGAGALTKSGSGVLTLGPTATIVSAAEISVNGGVLDVISQPGFAIGSGQTLSGANGEVLGSVVANTGATIRVGQTGMPQRLAGAYHDASYGVGGNTELAAGGVFTPAPGPGSGAANDTNWVERFFANGATVLQGISGVENPNGVSVLKTTIGGLNPGEQYEVYVNFWDDNVSGWRILAGDSASNLTLFDSPLDMVAGATDGVDPNSAFSYADAPLTVEGNRQMWGANLGILTANTSGEIEVFVDESSAAGAADRTWYDGVSISTGGTVSQGEAFSIDGDLSLNAGSTLAIDIASPGVSDLLSITGNLAVDGSAGAGASLVVTLDGSVSASSLLQGDSWNLLDFGSGSAAFATSNLTLPAGLSSELRWSFDASTGILSVVSGGLVGDFNGDNIVDAADYTVWRDNLGLAEDGLLSGNGDGGFVTQSDYLLWRANYGTSGSASAKSEQAAPEPHSLLLLVASMAMLARRRS